MKITLIGDLHGHKEVHQNFAKHAEASIALGDVDFEFDYLNGLDSGIHKILGGNHDNYDQLTKFPHYLGDFGVIWDQIGFLRGAWSPDRHMRTEGIDWWRQEELSVEEGYEALEFFEKNQPPVFISHECPETVFKQVHPLRTLVPTRTSQLLAALFTRYQPKLWVFGHHHVRREFKVNGTQFVGLKEMDQFFVSLPYSKTKNVFHFDELFGQLEQ